MKDDILNAVNEVRNGQADHKWVQRITKPAAADQNQFVVFLKPEAMDIAAGVQADKIVELVLDSLKQWNVDIHNIRALGGAYLDRHNVMGRHYGVINQISREGRTALTEDAEAKLQELFSEELASGAEVLGGHQFVDSQPEFSAAATCTISDNLGVTKLAGGSYGTAVKVLGKPFVLLNAFHPQQLVPFYDPAMAIVVMECVSKTSWSDLRQKLTGATNPLKAAKGSIRNQLLENKDELGMPDVSQGANGIHLSAGPLEGMVELIRFLADEDSGHSIPLTETSFGQRLIQEGASEGHVADLAMNPDVDDDGHHISAFDLTEEMDAAEAAAKLASVTLV